MICRNIAARNRVVSVILCFSIGLLAAPLSAQQIELPEELDVVGGNSSNSRMFWLNYDPEHPDVNVAVEINDDASSFPNLNSFTFFRNTCAGPRSDVIAASTNASEVVLYTGGRGTSGSICPGGTCPPRPDGLSTSTEQVISAVTTGAAGSTASVWLFKPTGCEPIVGADPDAEKATFTRTGGPISVDGVTSVRAAVDTVFVRAGVGGLEEGDLLVLTNSPAMIVRYPKAWVDGDQTGDGELLVDLASLIGKATPTGMALVPGEGDTANLLVTLSAGKAGEVFNVRVSGGTFTTADELAGSPGMFPNPRGIAAGVREEETYMVVSDQNQGRYIRVVLNAGDPANLSVSALPYAVRTIVSPVGAPQGVAINVNNNVQFASECFQPVTQPDGTTGCVIGDGSAQLHFSQGFDGELPRNAQVRAELTFVPDPSDDSARANGQLTLPGYEEQVFLVPATCRGFPTAMDSPFGGVPQLVLLDIELRNFAVTQGNFVLLTELTKEFLGLEGDCKDTAARIYHHPSKDRDGNLLLGGTLADTTFACQNPSRSIVENASPFVLCADPLHIDRTSVPNPDEGLFLDRLLVNEEIRIRLAALKATLDDLAAEGFTDVAGELKQLLVAFTNPDNRNATPAELRVSFLDTSAKADIGALAVFEMKKADAFSDPDLPADLYARLLSGFLGLAFYSSETGALQEYQPPWQFCEGIYTLPNLQGLFPELPDVECRPKPVF